MYCINSIIINYNYKKEIYNNENKNKLKKIYGFGSSQV